MIQPTTAWNIYHRQYTNRLHSAHKPCWGVLFLWAAPLKWRLWYAPRWLFADSVFFRCCHKLLSFFSRTHIFNNALKYLHSPDYLHWDDPCAHTTWACAHGLTYMYTDALGPNGKHLLVPGEIRLAFSMLTWLWMDENGLIFLVTKTGIGLANAM